MVKYILSLFEINCTNYASSISYYDDSLSDNLSLPNPDVDIEDIDYDNINLNIQNLTFIDEPSKTQFCDNDEKLFLKKKSINKRKSMSYIC